MKLSIPITETVQKRYSVRTYEDQALSEEDRKALVDCMNRFGIGTDRKL